ncbi:MAG TPA: UDP-N-acetylglucosamine 2-epimerase (non-hydrolyzing) [Xanthobacteraceae bacterium]|nr:UDP-N-acetylglucosamine 2-epimerase (non-hydrolyzing) [Xanthobacteraceae bacterium]
MQNSMIYLIAGARPNFMKIAPIVRALRARSERFRFRVVHTGQHYDREMSDVFFEELGIPKPDFHLEAGGGSHAEQTAKIMVAFERVCREAPPDHVMVVGDVNSTLACSIAAKKLGITVSHVEAGLRSFDRRMPEEINRVVTDAISDWFFCTEQSGVDHLLHEGKPQDAIFFVGHVMVDTLFYERAKLEASAGKGLASARLKQRLGRYGVVTLHRPSNVDEPKALGRLVSALREIAEDLPLVFPAHPRTRANLLRFGIELGGNLVVTEPLGYVDFLNLWRDAALVLTDSGGLQEETTALGVPCLTLRENTERPITVSEGTNTVVGTDPARIVTEAKRVLSGQAKTGRVPHLWDGKAAIRIVDHLDRLVR